MRKLRFREAEIPKLASDRARISLKYTDNYISPVQVNFTLYIPRALCVEWAFVAYAEPLIQASQWLYGKKNSVIQQPAAAGYGTFPLLGMTP